MRLVSLLVLCVFALPLVSSASEITIRPFLIDKTMVPRESATQNIVLTSAYDARKATVYATVNEITVDTEGQIREFISPVMTDRTNTVTSWIEVTRGRIELLPEESTEIPLTIKVHPYAELVSTMCILDL